MCEVIIFTKQLFLSFLACPQPFFHCFLDLYSTGVDVNNEIKITGHDN